MFSPSSSSAPGSLSARKSSADNTLRQHSQQQQQPWLAEADEYFRIHGVGEIRNVEANIRANIEAKKRDLREMVGTRYRDLIDAADAIISMRAATESVALRLETLKEDCSISQSKRALGFTHDQEQQQQQQQDAHRKALFALAAQIKLLVDTPEQIWHELENKEFLSACRLYLIAQQMYLNLQSTTDHQLGAGKISHQFPVIQRQWETVQHFKAQILSRSRSHLLHFDLSDINLVETLCAILLLDRKPPVDVFLELLHLRKRAIVENFKSPLQSSGDPPQDLVDGSQMESGLLGVCRNIKVTLNHISSVLLPSELEENNASSSTSFPGSISSRNARKPSSLLDAYLSAFENGFSRPTMLQTSALVSVNASSDAARGGDVAATSSRRPETTRRKIGSVQMETYSFAAGLYGPKSDVHLLSRYLPASIVHFVPFINYGNPGNGNSKEPTTDQKNETSNVENKAAGDTQHQIHHHHHLNHHHFHRHVLDTEHIRRECAAWISSIEGEAAAGISHLLSRVTDAGVLMKLKEAVWNELLDDERSLTLGQQPSRTSWKSISEQTLGSSYSIWDRLYRDAFQSRTKAVITEAMVAIPNQVSGLKDLLLLADSSITKRLHEGSNPWIQICSGTHSFLAAPRNNTSSIANAVNSSSSTLSNIVSKEVAQHVRGLFPSVIDIISKLDASFSNIRSLLDHLTRSLSAQPLIAVRRNSLRAALGPNAISNPLNETDLFHKEHDTRTVIEFFEHACVSALMSYKAALSEILHQLNDHLSQASQSEHAFASTENITRQMLFVGAVAIGIATSSQTIPPFLEFISKLRSKRDNTEQHALQYHRHGGLHESAQENQWPKILHAFSDLYVHAHDAWIDWVTSTAVDALLKDMKAFDWKDAASLRASWEVINTPGNEEQALIAVPVAASPLLMKQLFHVCTQIHGAGGHAMSNAILSRLSNHLWRKMMQVIFLPLLGISRAEFSNPGGSEPTQEPTHGISSSSSSSSPSLQLELGDAAFVQLLFDLRFLISILGGSFKKTDGEKEFNSLSQLALEAISAKIDPIDLSLIEGPIELGLGLFVLRQSCLLGFLIQSLSVSNECRKLGIKSQEKHNILPLANPVNRFATLPISYDFKNHQATDSQKDIASSNPGSLGNRVLILKAPRLRLRHTTIVDTRSSTPTSSAWKIVDQGQRATSGLLSGASNLLSNVWGQ